MSLNITGLDELIQTLGNLTDASTVDKTLMQGLMLGGKQIQATAKALCPVDTGQLRNSIEVTEISNGVDIGTNVEYAPYVEYGTGQSGDQTKNHVTVKKDKKTGEPYDYIGMKAQPFLYPAFEANKENVKVIAENTLQEAIRKAVK